MMLPKLATDEIGIIDMVQVSENFGAQVDLRL